MKNGVPRIRVVPALAVLLPGLGAELAPRTFHLLPSLRRVHSYYYCNPYTELTELKTSRTWLSVARVIRSCIGLLTF